LDNASFLNEASREGNKKEEKKPALSKEYKLFEKISLKK